MTFLHNPLSAFTEGAEVGGPGKHLEQRVWEAMGLEVFSKGSSSLGLGMLKHVNIPCAFRTGCSRLPGACAPSAWEGFPEWL